MRKDAERTVKNMTRMGMAFVALDDSQAAPLWKELAENYVEPGKRDRFWALVSRAPRRRELLDYSKFLCSSFASDARASLPLMVNEWLTSNGAHPACHRFDQRATVPVCMIQMRSVEPSMVASWPGLFVEFEAGRALAVGLDGERTFCDLRVKAGC